MRISFPGSTLGKGGWWGVRPVGRGARDVPEGRLFPNPFSAGRSCVRPTGPTGRPIHHAHQLSPPARIWPRMGLGFGLTMGIWHPRISKEASRAARQCRHDETNARRALSCCPSHVTCRRADIYTQVHTHTPEGRKNNRHRAKHRFLASCLPASGTAQRRTRPGRTNHRPRLFQSHPSDPGPGATEHPLLSALQ